MDKSVREGGWMCECRWVREGGWVERRVGVGG